MIYSYVSCDGFVGERNVRHCGVKLEIEPGNTIESAMSVNRWETITYLGETKQLCPDCSNRLNAIFGKMPV